MQPEVFRLLVFPPFTVLPALAQTAGPARAGTIRPVSKGDPNGTSCLTPQSKSGFRLPGPEVCLTNHYWAQLAAQQKRVNGTGVGTYSIPVEGIESSPPL
jgi:hypothetical protein